jgi:hypothetical protein
MGSLAKSVLIAAQRAAVGDPSVFDEKRVASKSHERIQQAARQSEIRTFAATFSWINLRPESSILRKKERVPQLRSVQQTMGYRWS